MRRALAFFAAIALSACSGSSTAPSPTPVTPTPPVIVTAPPTPPAPTRDPQLFSQVFWNEFVHNAFDAPGANTPLQRLTAAPMLYLKTVDEAGQPIDAVTLQTVEDAMRGVAPTWGGGRFGLAGVERGTDTKFGMTGWITVRWTTPSAGDICGRTTGVGQDGGAIDLNYLTTNASCKCNGSQIRPRTARHELGHAFGYWHTDSDGDVMRNGALGCDAQPSAREVYHATLAYQSAVGTTNSLQPQSLSSHVIVD